MLAVFGVIAFVGQIYVMGHPGYSEIIFEPDPVLGWKLASNIEFIHTGSHWYADEFSVPHKSNSLGFIGPERAVQKPAQASRIAILGDSFVEALQVPWEKSAAGVLERDLNNLGSSGLMPSRRYEVQNFGISNFGVGQYLIAWEEYASRYHPDYVFIFVTGMHMDRTTVHVGPFNKKISRPSFALSNGNLVRHPIEDFEESSRYVRNLVKERGGRTKKKKQQLFIKDWIRRGDMSRTVLNLLPRKFRLALKRKITDNPIQPFLPALKDKIAGFMKPSQTKTTTPPLTLEIDEETLAVNLRVMDELGQQVTQSGAQLIVVDASLYFWFFGANEILTQRIHDFCRDKGYGYVPLYKDLFETDRNNMWARYTHDGHFNEHGNALFAKNMLRWVQEDSQPPKRSIMSSGLTRKEF